MIDERLLSSRPKIRASNIFYISDLTKPCARKAYFDIVNPQEYPIKLLRIMETGKILEKYWVRILKQCKNLRVLDIQVPANFIAENFEIRGRIDVLAQHNNGELCLHEVKSIKSFNFLSQPRKDDCEQLQYYMNVLGVDVGQIDYIDKTSLLNGGENNYSIDLSFKVYRDFNIFNDLVSRANSLYHSINKRTIPKECKGWICNYCQHRIECEETICSDKFKEL